MQNIDNIIEILGKFKELKRTGWVRKKIENPESVADHCFGISLLALLLAPEGLDFGRCTKMAIVHDLAEVYVGDITPYDGISEEEKAKNEESAMVRIAEEINFPDIVRWFREYEDGETPEARFVKNIDKLESAVQAVYYQKHRKTEDGLAREFIKTAMRRSVADANDSEIQIIYQQLLDIIR